MMLPIRLFLVSKFCMICHYDTYNQKEATFLSLLFYIGLAILESIIRWPMSVITLVKPTQSITKRRQK